MEHELDNAMHSKPVLSNSTEKFKLDLIFCGDGEKNLINLAYTRKERLEISLEERI